MIKRDGHMHPNIMKKPSQGDDFILRAIELGFREIVFTDHMCFTVTGDEHDRIPFGMIGDYCRFVGEFAEKYKDKIRVLTGIEVDYHPTCIDEVKEVIGSGSFDVILGSSHLNIKGFGIPFGKISRTDYAKLVIENYIRAAESGFFDVITHLDVYRWVFTETEAYPLEDDGFKVSDVAPLLTRLFETMEKKDIALEFNTAPFYKGFFEDGAYPAWDILRLASDYRLRYVFGSDAHSADRVGYAYGEFERFMEQTK